MTTTELQTTNENCLSEQTSAESTARRTFVPRADVYESATDIVVLADLPGVEEKDVDITVEKNILTIKATAQQQIPANHHAGYLEYTVGDFMRKFALSNEINRDAIAATLKNGVLRLVLPKSTSAQIRKISVQAE